MNGFVGNKKPFKYQTNVINAFISQVDAFIIIERKVVFVLVDITMKGDVFSKIGIEHNDVLYFEQNTEYQYGDIVLLEYKGKHQPLWYIGTDILGYPILVSEYYKYPKAFSFRNADMLKGRMVRIEKNETFVRQQ